MLTEIILIASILIAAGMITALIYLFDLANAHDRFYRRKNVL